MSNDPNRDPIDDEPIDEPVDDINGDDLTDETTTDETLETDELETDEVYDEDVVVDTEAEDQTYGERFKEFFRSEPESEDWSKRPTAGTGVNRRGFITAAAIVGAGGGYILAGEVLDDDDPVAPAFPDDDNNEDNTATALNRGNEYRFDTEEELLDQTGLCNPSVGNYIGAKDAEQLEDLLDDDQISGRDPSGTLSSEEINMDFDDLTAVQNMYAVDVDRRQGNDGDFGYFVQLVGEEDGGMYVTRSGASELTDELEFQELFEGYQECN